MTIPMHIAGSHAQNHGLTVSLSDANRSLLIGGQMHVLTVLRLQTGGDNGIEKPGGGAVVKDLGRDKRLQV